MKEKTKYSYYKDFPIIYDIIFDPIKAYLKESNKMLEGYEKELNQKIAKWEKDKSKYPDIPDVIDHFWDEISNVDKFNDVSNGSVFISVYALFEDEFSKICLFCKEVEKLRLSHNDIYGKGYIGQCRKYITHLLEVDLDSLNTQWDAITKYRQIRNSIAHNGGIVSRPNESFLKFIDSIDGVSLDDKTNKLTISSSAFPSDFIDIVVEFLLGVAKNISDQKD